jgi:hypothetical protein
MNQSQIDTLTSNIFKNILSQIEFVIHNMKSTFHNEFSNTNLVLSVSIKILYMDCERLNKFILRQIILFLRGSKIFNLSSCFYHVKRINCKHTLNFDLRLPHQV